MANVSTSTVQPSNSGTAANPGSVLRQLWSIEADIVNVLDYGAVGNGSTDNLAAFKAAFNALPSSGGEMFIPPGNYVLSADPAFGGKPIKIRGAGRRTTTLTASHSNKALSITQTSWTQPVQVEDISISANGSGATAIGIQITHPSAPGNSFPWSTTLVRNVEFLTELSAPSAPFPGSFTVALDLYGQWSARIENVIGLCGQGTVGGVVGNITGTVTFRFANSIGINYTGCQSYAADAAFQYNGYSEELLLIIALQ